MAEAALKDELKKRKIRWYVVSSAGLSPHEGAPMSANAHTFADMGAANIVIQNTDMGMPDHQSCFFSDLSLTSS